MGIFSRKPKIDQNAINLRNQNMRLERENQKLSFMNSVVKSMSAKMESLKSFPDEFYPTGIKQGPYSGLLTSDNSTARNRSRKAVNISPVAESITNTISTLTVGKGLELEAQPIWRLIPGAAGWTDEKRSEWMKTAEARYRLWAKRKSTSYEENQNRYQQEQQEFYDLLVDGEYFEIYRYAGNSKLNPMTIQIIKPEDVRSPSGSVVATGNFQEDGIEYNAKGQAVAYHIYDYTKTHTVRVIKKGSRSGRIFVNHVKLGKNRRGIGIIANMVSELVKLGDYEVLELQAAIVNALYAVWVETPEGEDGPPVLNRSIGSSGQASADQITTEQWQNDRKEINYTEGGFQIDMLPGGTKLQSFDTKRPNVNFDAFNSAIKKNLAASKNIPLSVVDKQFESSYSASRGELILAWYEIDKYRFNQSMTNETVYQMWLWGEVLRSDGIEAKGFIENQEIREAWSGSKWIGNQRPDIDPLRSVKAHIEEQNRAFKTGKQITSERDGGDYDENLVRVKEELEKVSEMQSVFETVDVNLNDQ